MKEEIIKIYNKHINNIINATSQEHNQAVNKFAKEIDDLYIYYPRQLLIEYENFKLLSKEKFNCSEQAIDAFIKH